MSRSLYKKMKEVISYLFFGVVTTVINWAVYSIATAICGLSMNISNVLAWIVAVLAAFVTNKSWVFGSNDWSKKNIFEEFTKFIGARVFTGIIEIAGLPALYALGINQSIFGIEGMVAKVIVSIVVIILNYIFSKLIVFKKGIKNENTI